MEGVHEHDMGFDMSILLIQPLNKPYDVVTFYVGFDGWKGLTTASYVTCTMTKRSEIVILLPKLLEGAKVLCDVANALSDEIQLFLNIRDTRDIALMIIFRKF